MKSIYDWRKQDVISTLDDLILGMYTEHWGTGTMLQYDNREGRSPHDGTLFVSRDCNYYVDTSSYKVSQRVCIEAISRRLVSGVPKWGYTSTHEWALNEEGRSAALSILRRYHESEKTARMKPIEDHDPGDECHT